MIRWPKLHVAESALNRMMNAIDGIESGGFSLPSIPEQPPAGAELDRRLSSAPGGAAPDSKVIQNAATGKASALQSLIEE